MKFLTLNTHSLAEKNYHQKLLYLVSFILREQPDIIAFQEVNQSHSGERIPLKSLKGFYPCEENTVIKKDNHAYNVVKLLSESGLLYYWSWINIKLGYGKYDEGIAVLSKNNITEAKSVLISKINDYNNWKTRKIIGIRNKEIPDVWFYSVHFGWWNDSEEPFQEQWKLMCSQLDNKNQIWLMGDFNNPAEIRNEGYDMIAESGWYDSYNLAAEKDNGITVEKIIDGWNDKISTENKIRIDQIWCNRKNQVKSSRILFNGINEPVVSDHYGIMIEL